MLDVDNRPIMSNERISDSCRDIRQQLVDLLAVLKNESAPVSTVASSSVKDILEKFMLWAGNLGALRKPTSKLSLDSRLAGSSDLRDYIYTELEDMSEALEDLLNIVNGSLPNREIGYGSGSENDLDMGSDESSYFDNPVDEAGSILQVISQGITSLLKIGILVRQPASSGTDRFYRASRDSINAFLDRFDIDYVRHKHPKLGDGEQSSRMGRANAKRRQFIRYCLDHKDNLAAEEEEGKTESQKATTAKQSSKATTFVAKENLMDILQGSADILGEEEDAVSLCSVSTTSDSLAVLKLPRLADLSPEDDPFECPICYTLQRFRSEQAWRRHAYRDLKAYVCTVGGAECDDKFFEDRTSWFDHELEEHRCNYMCVLCGVNDGKTKTTRSNLRQHILSAHGDFESDQLERLEDAGRETITSFKTNDCPFCDDWSKLMVNKKPPGREAQLGDGFLVSMSRFKKHVAMHLEQLAIFAVPRHGHQTDMNEDASYGSDSRGIESRSSDSFAGSFRSGHDRDFKQHLHQVDQIKPFSLEQVRKGVEAKMMLRPTPTTGWQSTDIQLLERVQRTSGLAVNLKLAGQVDTWPEAMKDAIDYERWLLVQSPNKPTYENLFDLRLRQLVQQRQAHASVLPSTNERYHDEGSLDSDEAGTRGTSRGMDHKASSRGLPFTEFPSFYDSFETQPLFPAGLKASFSQEHLHGENEDIRRSGSHDSDKKETEGMEYVEDIELPSLPLGFNAFMQIEDQQQGVDHSVGKSSQTPESTESLEPDGKLAARPSSPKDITTREPAGASNSGINASPPLMSAEGENRQMKWEKQLASLKERLVAPSAVIAEEDRILVELKQQGKSFADITSFDPQQRSESYWEGRWRRITDVLKDNSDEERRKDDWSTLAPSLQREEAPVNKPPPSHALGNKFTETKWDETFSNSSRSIDVIEEFFDFDLWSRADEPRSLVRASRKRARNTRGERGLESRTKRH